MSVIDTNDVYGIEDMTAMMMMAVVSVAMSHHQMGPEGNHYSGHLPHAKPTILSTNTTTQATDTTILATITTIISTITTILATNQCHHH